MRVWPGCESPLCGTGPNCCLRFHGSPSGRKPSTNPPSSSYRSSITAPNKKALPQDLWVSARPLPQGLCPPCETCETSSSDRRVSVTHLLGAAPESGQSCGRCREKWVSAKSGRKLPRKSGSLSRWVSAKPLGVRKTPAAGTPDGRRRSGCLQNLDQWVFARPLGVRKATRPARKACARPGSFGYHRANPILTPAK